MEEIFSSLIILRKSLPFSVMFNSAMLMHSCVKINANYHGLEGFTAFIRIYVTQFLGKYIATPKLH